MDGFANGARGVQPPSLVGRVLATALWCWGVAVGSCLLMADPGAVKSAADLPKVLALSTAGVFFGPLFFFAGLFGRFGFLVPIDDPALGPWLGLGGALVSYAAYGVLLLGSVGSWRAGVRWTCRIVIALGAIVAWQGLRSAI